MDTIIIWLKIGGATAGASIAVVFKPDGDPWMKLVLRVIIGIIIGFISAPIIREYLGWGLSFDHWLAASTLGGLSGYMFLQVLFGVDAVNFIKGRMTNKKEDD